MAKIDKARFWVGVLYPENMREGWQEDIGDTLQLPYAYCLHNVDKDTKSEHRKDHIHLIVAFPNTTTYNHALNVFELLSAEGRKALNTVQAVINIRSVYDYLIHDTDDCRKKGKELYPAEARITGNNFDIGAYEQLGAAEKLEMCIALGEVIRNEGFTNYMDFYEYVIDNYDDINYFDVMRTYSGHFEKLTRGNYQRWEQQQQRGVSEVKTPRKLHENSTTICCPECGSVSVVKSGKTLAGSQRWACKDCGKRFV